VVQNAGKLLRPAPLRWRGGFNSKGVDMAITKYNNRRDMPSCDAIKSFWLQTSIFILKGVQNTDLNFCFACNRIFYERLERAHIHALWAGGSNRPENLHLLCSACHKDSEDFGFGIDRDKYCYDFDQSIYWAWFFNRTAQQARFSDYMRDAHIYETGWKSGYTHFHVMQLAMQTYKYNKVISSRFREEFKRIHGIEWNEDLRNRVLNGEKVKTNASQ
jgi:hypothetical protein